MSKLLNITIAVAAITFSTLSFGVSEVSVVKSPDELNHVTTDFAERAEAEVQIRRIKNMLITQIIDGDAAFEKLEKLQHSLHGSN